VVGIFTRRNMYRHTIKQETTDTALQAQCKICVFLIQHVQFLTKYPVYILVYIVTQILSTINQPLEATQYHKIMIQVL